MRLKSAGPERDVWVRIPPRALLCCLETSCRYVSGRPSTSRSPVGLVVPSRIEGEPTDQLPVFAQHPDVAVGHEHEHPGADEPTSQPDVVRPRVVAKRDRAGDVDLVPSDPEVGRDYEPRQPWRRPSAELDERLGAGTAGRGVGAAWRIRRSRSSRPRTSAQQRRRATGALALRGCGLGLASDLEWSCRTTLAHVLAALLSYAINLATRSTELRFSGQADPSFSIPELLDALEGRPQFLPWYARRPRPTLAGRTTRPMPRLLARPRRGLAGRVGSTPDGTRHDDPAV